MAVSKPTLFPEFALLDLNNGTAGAPNVVEPSSGKKDSGWNEGERPPRETFNWLHRITDEWIKYFDCVIEEGLGGKFNQDVAATSGLNFAVSPGKATVGGDEFETVVNTVLALVDDAVNFVWLNVQEDGIGSSFAVLSADEATVPSELDGDDGTVSIVPLFRVTTVAGAITVVQDLRSWITIPFTDYERLNSRTFTAAGKGATRIQFVGTDSTPSPDMAVTNFFLVSPNVTPGAIAIQTPANPGVTVQTDPIFIAIELDNSSQTVSWSAAYNFVGDTSNGAIDGTDGLSYLAVGFYDPTLLEWKMALSGGNRTFQQGSPGQNGTKAYRSAATAVLTTDVETVVSFPQEAYDTNSFHDTSTNNSRITIPSGVTKVTLTAYCRFSSYLSGGKRVRIRKNGGVGSIDDNIAGSFIPEQVIAGGVAQEGGVQVTSGQILVDTGDYFEMYIESLNQTGVTGEANNVWFELEVIE